MKVRNLCVVILVSIFSVGCGGQSNNSNGDSQLMVQYINEARMVSRECGSEGFFLAVPDIYWDDTLAAVASKHSIDMADNSFFAHEGSDGSDLPLRLFRENYNYSTAAENIYFGSDKTARDVVDAWLASDGHCKNLMNRDTEEIGAGTAFGVYEESSGDFWTLVLGKRL